jgi:hypothetical protein
VVAILWGELLHVDMFTHNKTGIATEIGADGQRPLLITKGNPISSRGCYQVVPIEHQLYQVYHLSTRAGEACQQHQVHLSLIQAASKVQDTGGGSYLTRSHSISPAQEAGPTGLQSIQSVAQRGLSLMSEHHSHTIRVTPATSG